ncbi:MAG: four helix bundle protein [Pirellulales bacterium]
MGYDSTFGLDDFELYRLARQFRVRTYALIRRLPVEERYALAPQMRRAAISISNNIAEGHGRWYYQDNMRFCRISRGSVEEVIDDLNICLDEKYADADEILLLKEQAKELIARINGYLSYLKRSKQGAEKR